MYLDSAMVHTILINIKALGVTSLKMLQLLKKSFAPIEAIFHTDDPPVSVTSVKTDNNFLFIQTINYSTDSDTYIFASFLSFGSVLSQTLQI
ncbi:hypothetical protein MTR_0864s0010 [Medicago truncatula]|uniref:Uncharacterized protein n=1 Tax=Medicago truncatula TaxID=3880 RepID=A0A072TDA6_MEDTR|nr:hypothetical protein MTR_0864s0010 [Medicago truncatula]